MSICQYAVLIKLKKKTIWNDKIMSEAKDGIRGKYAKTQAVSHLCYLVKLSNTSFGIALMK